MRLFGTVVAVGAAIAMSACGGENAAPAAGAMAPITGTTHEVKMVGDGTGYRFEPADITVKAGDGIKFVFVSGGPHNVAFDAATIAPAAKTVLAANMPEQQGELAGKMMLAAGESYTVSFAGMPAGTYDYYCTPHLAMGMKGKVTVQ